jgi:hypothetical protein
VANKFPWKNEGHRALLDGMWNYFSKKSCLKSTCCHFQQSASYSCHASYYLLHSFIKYEKNCNSWIIF